MTHRALITGVSGFAGSFLAEHLLQCGDAVLGCSADGMWEDVAPEELRDQVELLAWDLGDPGGPGAPSRRRIEEFQPDRVYHLGALSVPADCGGEEPSARAVAVNVDGTRRVLELAGSLPSGPRVLFASTCRVYAPVSQDSPQVDETAPVGPRQAYGRTKLAAEAEVQQTLRGQGCEAVIARGFQHTGPRQNARMMLPQWARQFTRGGCEPVEVHTLDAHLDLTDGRDVVRAYRLLIEHGKIGEIYNIGSGISRRSGDILDLLRKMADPKRPIVESRPETKQEPIADITRLVECTGWEATIPLEKTIADTLDWWRQAFHLEERAKEARS